MPGETSTGMRQAQAAGEHDPHDGETSVSSRSAITKLRESPSI